MSPEEIHKAAEQGTLPLVEDVNPLTAKIENGYLVVSGRAAMPLDGVSWSIDRSSDQLISDELGSALGTLCLTKGKPPFPVEEMTRWQYTAYLADCESDALGNTTYQFTRDYAVIDEPELARYLQHYISGSALWGGFHHGTSSAGYVGWRREIKARPNVLEPTAHHRSSFMLLTQASGPREQYLKIYHTIELLFDYITFRKIVKSGENLVGFGKVMSAFQRSELDRLKSIFRDFCGDVDAIASKMAGLAPFLDRAEQMFQLHSKDGNPLNDEAKWERFRTLVASGSVDFIGSKNNSLATTRKAFVDLFVPLAAYQIYRIRSSIAHNRIGEYVLTDEDDEFVAKFGIALIEEVALQIFASHDLAALIA